jgi:hypothetical protein
LLITESWSFDANACVSDSVKNNSDISGKYLDNYNLEVWIYQFDNRISGHIGDPNNEMTGSRDGDEISVKFGYTPSGMGGAAGSASLCISSDGRKLTGTISKVGVPKNSKWELSKLGPDGKILQ